MEMVIPLFPSAPAFIIIVITISTLIIMRGRRRAAKLPPSPWKLPIVGNLHQLLWADAVSFRALGKLAQRCGPIMHLKLGQVDHVIISGSEAAREILKTHDINFASRPELTASKMVLGERGISFAPYGSQWRHMRKIGVLELLSARRVKTYRNIMEGENLAFIQSITSDSAGKSPINLQEKLLLLGNTVTALAAFGKECKFARRFILATKRAIRVTSGFYFVDLFPSLGFLDRLFGTTTEIKKVKEEFDEILDDIIGEQNQRRLSRLDGDEVENILDVLIRLKDEGGLDFPISIADIKTVIIELFIGGTETTSMLLTWVMSELMRHPPVMMKVQGEVRQLAKEKGILARDDLESLHYMKQVIQETLRMHPPLPLLLPRVCRETTNVGEFEIPVGSRVIINAWAIAKDQKYWEDAEIFKPERFEGSSLDYSRESFQYLPFGGGRRMCPGVKFGLANVELTLAQLLLHFDWELPDGKELDMTEIFGATLSKKSDLCLIATPWIFA